MRTHRVKELAADIMKIGKDRVWINPGEEERVSEAMTKEDVRALISEGIIKKRKPKCQSAGRTRALAKKKSKGRKRGFGKRKGKKSARMKKKKWASSVRAQRRTLSELKKKMPRAVKKIGYSKIYRMIKGNYFKGKRYVEEFVKEKGGQ